MTKKIWNECNVCGTITDIEDKCCSACGSNLLTQIKLDKNKVKELIRAGKVYTKHLSEIERWLLQ